MRTTAVRWAICAAAIFSAAPLRADVRLVPVVSGLSSPLFVGHAGDGSNRVFIVEQGGLIKVLQPGASTPTVFLDIRTRLVAAASAACSGWRFIRSTS